MRLTNYAGAPTRFASGRGAVADFDASLSQIDAPRSLRMREGVDMTTAQTGLSVSDPQAYRDHLFASLGDRDPLEVLGQTASALADIVRTHSADVLRARPFEGKWTPNELIGHLADGEWVGGYRLRLILCEESPTILGMNQDSWVVGQRHNEREPSELVDMFRTLRQFNLAVWRRLSPADLRRTGRHNERGPESLAVMLRMLAGHDLAHLEQLGRYLHAVRQG
jgi:DinB family protein